MPEIDPRMGGMVAATAAMVMPPSYPYAQAQQAQDIRDASLRNKADESNGYLRQAHNLLDELEDALQGPRPRNGEETAKNNPGHPGLRAVLNDNSASSATLVGRLQTLLGSL